MESLRPKRQWSCLLCTFLNPFTSTRCEMCYTEKGASAVTAADSQCQPLLQQEQEGAEIHHSNDGNDIENIDYGGK